MATLLDTQAGLVDEAWAVQIEIQRALGQVAEHVQLGQGGGAVLQRGEMANEPFEQGLVQHLLARQRSALGRQRLVFEGFQLRRDEALGTFECLPANVVARCLLRLLARQLDVVTVYTVVADLEVGQAGAGFFAGFQVDEELAGVLAHRQQLVKLAVVACLEYASVADHCRRSIDNGAFEQAGQLRVGAGNGCQARQVRRLQLSHGVLQFGQGAQGVAQPRQVAGPRIAQANTGQDTLDVADVFELRLQLFEAIAVEQTANRVLPRLHGFQVAQRAIQPAGKQAAGHGGLAAVQHRLQRVVATTSQVDVQLQVAPARGVQDHRVVQALVAQASQVGQGGALGFLGVGQ